MATITFDDANNLNQENREEYSIDATGVTHDTAEPSWDEIAAEAYVVFMSRGDQEGTDLEDWLEAERRLRLRALTS